MTILISGYIFNSILHNLHKRQNISYKTKYILLPGIILNRHRIPTKKINSGSKKYHDWGWY